MIKTIISSWIVLCIAIFVGAYGVLYYEQQAAHTSIVNYEDALWWSVNVSSAVGDCDICPQTTGGRVVSVVLMFIGYALFSINMAILVSWFKHEIDTINSKTQYKKK
ncbi:potassium channel family protein [Paenibacillus sp.]